MDEVKATDEQLRAIERWENEGGRVSRAGRIPVSTRIHISNEKPAPQEELVPRGKQDWQNVKVWPTFGST